MERAAYFGKLDIICHCKALWNGWQSSCRKEDMEKSSCLKLHVTIHEVICSQKKQQSLHEVKTRQSPQQVDSRSIGECRSEVFFTSPPNTKKGRSGYGRSMEMNNFKMLSFSNYHDYYISCKWRSIYIVILPATMHEYIQPFSCF